MALFLAIVLVFSLPATPGTPADRVIPGSHDRTQDLLQEGLKAEEKGNYEKALYIWLQAKAQAERPSVRLGRNYVRVAAAQGIDDYYEAASAMYLWGISGEDVTFQKEYLVKEVAYLEPMLTEEERETWDGFLKENDPALLERMRTWWRARDPTPATPYNERLMEHWERIAYAREHYTRTTRSVYGTDDRGEVYVQYGEPDEKHEGNMNIMPAEVCQVIRERMALADRYVSCNEEGVRKVENLVWELWPNPYYEIWIYDEPNEEMRYNMVKIFSENAYGGSFGLINTLDEIIQGRAFSQSGRNAFGPVTAGIVMQWLAYNKLASVDAYFADRFGTLDFRFMRRGSPRYLGGQMKQENFHVTRQEQNKEPEEVSTHANTMNTIPVEVHQYRLLGETGRPVFATFVDSRPQPAFMRDLVHNQEAMFPDTAPADTDATGDSLALADSLSLQRAFGSYRLFHGMELRGEDGRPLAGERMQPTLMIDGRNMQVASGSVFLVPHHPEGVRQLFYAELHNRHPDSEPQVETPFPDHLRGMGRTEVEPPEPLDPDPSRLQMGDLILGYQKADLEEEPADRFVPFVVANRREIPVGEQLAVHVELYHLQEGESGLRDFTLEYEIRPLNFLGWTRERKDALTVTLFLEHDAPRFTENLEIQAANLDPGRYVLRMRATDRVSGQTVRREIEFEVTESGSS